MKVGIQLYSVKTAMGKDPADAIAQVLDIGYRNLEVANHRADQDYGVGFGISAPEVNALIRPAGAQIVGAHLSPLKAENTEKVLDFHAEIGNKNIIMPMSFFSGKDDVLRLCEEYNALGEKCKSRGMRFLYHNHFHEFSVLDGEEVIKTMLDNTQPDLVYFELDTYWAMRAGMDPLAVIRNLGSRLVMLHQKDYPKGRAADANLFDRIDRTTPVTMEMFMQYGDPTLFTEIGTGVMDIQAIIDAGNQAGVEYIVLEQDATQLDDEMESVRLSMEAFRRFSGIEW